MEKVLGTGCSFSDPNYEPYEYPVWMEIVTKDCDLTNISEFGQSNNYLIPKLTQTLLADPSYDMVILGLTDWMRHTMWSYRFKFAQRYEECSIGSKGNRFFGERDIENFTREIHEIFNDTLTHLFTLIKVCEHLDKELIVAQIVEPLPEWFKNKSNGVRKLIDNETFNLIDESCESLVHWPFFDELGGSDFYQEVKRLNLVISEDDGHPNKEGHELIAANFSEAISSPIAKGFHSLRARVSV